MELGWLDVCIRCLDVERSREFYEGLGFAKVEGEDSEGWAVVVKGTARIGLFSVGFMDQDRFSFNFRGGNIPQIAQALKERGYFFAEEPKFTGEAGGSLRLQDPDGNLVFIDSFDGEQIKSPPSPSSHPS